MDLSLLVVSLILCTEDFFNPPIHPPQQAQPKKYTTAYIPMTNYKSSKSIQPRKKSVQSLNNKLKGSAIIKSKTTPPLDPRSPQTHASRMH